MYKGKPDTLQNLNIVNTSNHNCGLFISLNKVHVGDSLGGYVDNAGSVCNNFGKYNLRFFLIISNAF
jgi:hypothetical protein